MADESVAKDHPGDEEEEAELAEPPRRHRKGEQAQAEEAAQHEEEESEPPALVEIKEEEEPITTTTSSSSLAPVTHQQPPPSPTAIPASLDASMTSSDTTDESRRSSTGGDESRRSSTGGDGDQLPQHSFLALPSKLTEPAPSSAEQQDYTVKDLWNSFAQWSGMDPPNDADISPEITKLSVHDALQANKLPNVLREYIVIGFVDHHVGGPVAHLVEQQDLANLFAQGGAGRAALALALGAQDGPLADIRTALHAIQAAQATMQAAQTTMQAAQTTMQATLASMQATQVNERRIKTNQVRLAAHLQLVPLQKTVAGNMAAPAGFVPPPGLAVGAAVGTAPALRPAPGIFPSDEDDLGNMSHQDITTLMWWYNEDFGIVAGDGVASKRNKVREWLGGP